MEGKLQPDIFLISDFQTGLDENRQPWLIPRDAFTLLTNGRIFKGVLEPRKGVEQFAKLKCVGDAEGLTNLEILPKVSISTSLPATGPIYITDGTGGFTVEIDNADNFYGDFDVAITPTIDRGLGTITFDWSSGSATNQPTLRIPESCEDPVMSLANFIEPDGVRQLIGINTDYVNKYNSATRTFIPLVFSGNYPTTTFTGNETNFFSSINYPFGDETPRLVFTNNIDAIAFVDLLNRPLAVLNYTDTTDNPDFEQPSASLGGNLNKALHIFYFGERLVLLQPTLGSTVYPTGYLYSAIRDAAGNGDKFNSPGAGLQIIPDETPITGATLMGDRLIVFTQQNAWEITVTQSFDLPFQHRRLMDSDFQMSSAKYGTINWLRQAYGFGFWGIFRTDGRQTSRADNKIPFFTRNDIEQNNIGIVNAGAVMESSEIWWTYPSLDQDNSINFADRVLALNFEEESFAKYNLPLTTFGTFSNTTSVAWDDVDESFGVDFEHWEQWDTTDEIWDSFFWQSGAFNSIAGDKLGNVMWLEQGYTDQCMTITNVSQANSAVITLDEQVFEEGDRVRIDGVVSASLDMEEIINGFEFIISEVSGNTITINLDTSEVSAYSTGGYVCKLLSFSVQTKALNPYAEKNKKCRLHKIWFYIDTGTDNFLLDFYVDRRTDPYKRDVVLSAANTQGLTTKKWISITINQTGFFHTIRIRQEGIQNRGRIHGIMLQTTPTGRLS